MNKNFKKAMLFVGLTFSVNWLMAILFFAFGGKWGSPASLAMAGSYMFVPMVIAVIVQKFIYKEPLKKPLGISFRLNRWFLIAWLLPPIIAVATIGVSLIFPGVEFTSNAEASRIFEYFRSILPAGRLQELENQTSSLPFHPFWFALLMGLIAGITVNAIAGFGEELGWRGLLQREFESMGFWKSSTIIGVIWGVWHAPLILQGHNYPQHPVIGVFMMIILCVLLAPIFSYVRLRANSVIAAAIIHGSLNATAGLSLMVIKGGNDLTVGVTGLAGFIVLAFVNIGLLLYDRLLTKEPIMVG
jgi:membrane protease YdiL (CAAX protease family)